MLRVSSFLLKECRNEEDSWELWVISKVYELIESIFDSKGVCPYCSQTESYRHGIKNGLQRYWCKACKKIFNTLTGTLLANLRHNSKWLDYLWATTESLRVRKTAKEINVHRNTTFRWRHRFFSWIQKNRPPRKRGGSATKRGVSRE